MAKNKKELTEDFDDYSAIEEAKPTKKQKGQLSVWDHHDTMIVNLRMWVEREINNLQHDIHEHVPAIESRPALKEALTKAQDLNLQLWDQIRIIQEMADKAPIKKL